MCIMFLVDDSNEGHLPTKQVHSPIEHSGLLGCAGSHGSKAADAQALPYRCEGLLILHWIHKPCIPADPTNNFCTALTLVLFQLKGLLHQQWWQ